MKTFFGWRIATVGWADLENVGGYITFGVVHVSISSTFYVQIFCLNVVSAAFFLVTCTLCVCGKSYRNDIRTKNLYVKCWWNWRQILRHQPTLQDRRPSLFADFLSKVALIRGPTLYLLRNLSLYLCTNIGFDIFQFHYSRYLYLRKISSIIKKETTNQHSVDV